MSLSTTSSAVFNLTKYSRCYPSTDPASQQSEQWQHYSNPVLKISLDAKKRLSGSGNGDDFESYRLRVTWSIANTSDDIDMNPRDIVFVRPIVSQSRTSAYIHILTLYRRKILTSLHSLRQRSYRTIHIPILGVYLSRLFIATRLSGFDTSIHVLCQQEAPP